MNHTATNPFTPKHLDVLQLPGSYKLARSYRTVASTVSFSDRLARAARRLFVFPALSISDRSFPLTRRRIPSSRYTRQESAYVPMSHVGGSAFFPVLLSLLSAIFSPAISGPANWYKVKRRKLNDHTNKKHNGTILPRHGSRVYPPFTSTFLAFNTPAPREKSFARSQDPRDNKI